MQYKIAGADRNSGADVEFLFDAADEKAALAEAQRRGVLVSDCKVHRKPRPAWIAPTAIFGTIGVAAAVGITLFIRSENASIREKTVRDNEVMVEAADRSAAAADRRRQEYEAMAAEAKEKAERLRAAAKREAAEALVAQSSGRQFKSKSEAIASDPYISYVVNQIPGLEYSVTSDPDGLGTLLALHVGQGRLTPSDTDRITRFADRIRNLPDR